jgi:hypothetical protein
MRLVVLGIALFSIASPLHAAPFTPEIFSLEVVNQRFGFDTTGDDEMCFRCDDADPANDVELALQFHGGTSGFLPFPSTLGSLDIGFFTAFGEDFTDLFAQFRIDVVLTLTQFQDSAPPLVGITPGVLFGVIFGDQYTCCLGMINTMDFGPTDFPQDPLMAVNHITLQVFRPRDPQTTAVPEPMSLVLVTTGAVGWIARRRNSKTEVTKTLLMRDVDLRT